MYLASKRAFISKNTFLQSSNNAEHEQEELDTNVFSIDFSILKNAIEKVHQGDPTSCKKCKAILNSFSIITKPQLQKGEEEQKQFQIGSSLWVCEFCGEENYIMIEEEEIPQKKDTIYLVQSAQQIKSEKQNLASEHSVVFCIDISGSMCTSSEIKGQIALKHGLSPEEYEMLKQFMEPGDEQQLHMMKNVTFISRKQCVLAAIENQINELRLAHPNRIVGLVTFNDEVTIFGDGSQNPIVLAGDKLNDEIEIRQICNQLNNCMNRNVTETNLIDKLNNLKEKGQTALGPALLSSVILASKGKPGSMVIICTDGLANKGLGSIDDNAEKATQFYQQIGQEAKQFGISLSIITIKGEGCRMDILSKLAEETEGNVTRVSPENIGKDFSNILSDEVVGTQVQMTVQIHRILKFRNENEEVSDCLVRELGNTTVKTQIAFEYQVKKQKELGDEKIDLNDIKKVPFQIRILYNSMQGDRLLRVLTEIVDTTQELEEAESQADVGIIHQRIRQQTAKLARQGDLVRATEFNMNWDKYIGNSKPINEDRSQTVSLQMLQGDNKQIQHLIQKKQKVQFKTQSIEPKQQIRKSSEEVVQFQDNQLQQEKLELNEAIDNDEDDTILFNFEKK